MPGYQTPGVYYERVDSDAGGIAALRTDIAGFVGIAARGPLHLAVPVESYRQFQTWFGDVIDNGYLAYSARAFFENGGRRLWVVRVGSEATSTATLSLPHGDGTPAWRVDAASPGVAGNDISVRLVEVRRVQQRGSADNGDMRRLRLGSIAGIGAYTLIEIWQGALAIDRRIVRAVDAIESRVTLDQPVAGLAPGTAVRVESIAWSLEVYELGRLIGVFEDLSLVPEHARYGPAVLKQPWQSVDPRDPEAEPAAAASDQALKYFRSARGRGLLAPPPVVLRELRDEARRLAPLLLAAGARVPAPLTGGADGLAALTVMDFAGAPVPADASDLLRAQSRRGLRALEPVEEIGVLAVPDINIQPREPQRFVPPPPCEVDGCLPPPLTAPLPRPAPAVGDLPPRFDFDSIYRVQAVMITQCEMLRDRVALLDAPFDTCNGAGRLASELRAWRRRFDSRFAALYAPWLDVVDPLAVRPGAARDRKLTRAIPPSGHVAGIIAATDFRRGVHAAPANVPLNWAQSVSLDIDDERHGLLNELGVNVIRAQAGRGLRPLGARTVCSDPDWRYLNVRRLMSMIGKSIDASIQWAVFEPNDWRTRTRLVLVISSFLQELWSRGALAGASPEQAYFIRCNESNNTPDGRERGELVIDVGVAPTVPFEFIVLRVGRDANGFAISESEPRSAAA
jgi:phage tail sheath protein FI